MPNIPKRLNRLPLSGVLFIAEPNTPRMVIIINIIEHRTPRRKMVMYGSKDFLFTLIRFSPFARITDISFGANFYKK